MHITRRTRLIQGISKATKSRRYMQVPKMYLHVPSSTNDGTLTCDTYSHTPDHQHTSNTSSNEPIQSRIIGAFATSDKGAEKHTRTAKGSRGAHHIDNGPFSNASYIYRGVLIGQVCGEPPHTTHGDTNRLAQGATASPSTIVEHRVSPSAELLHHYATNTKGSRSPRGPFTRSTL